jgi:hypothetical protein
LIYGLGSVGPSPSAGEGAQLRLADLTGSFPEQDVVIRVGIDRRERFPAEESCEKELRGAGFKV